MKIADIEFPTPLLNALRDGKLVIFAGAGVSRGEPACLPDFKSLANTIAKGTGKSLKNRDPDVFLGELQDDGVKVHDRAAELLSQEGLKATELHHNLLQLYSGAERVRVVTTNFDLLFEQAAEKYSIIRPRCFEHLRCPWAISSTALSMSTVQSAIPTIW